MCILHCVSIQEFENGFQDCWKKWTIDVCDSIVSQHKHITCGFSDRIYRFYDQTFNQVWSCLYQTSISPLLPERHTSRFTITPYSCCCLKSAFIAWRAISQSSHTQERRCLFISGLWKPECSVGSHRSRTTQLIQLINCKKAISDVVTPCSVSVLKNILQTFPTRQIQTLGAGKEGYVILFSDGKNILQIMPLQACKYFRSLIASKYFYRKALLIIVPLCSTSCLGIAKLASIWNPGEFKPSSP